MVMDHFDRAARSAAKLNPIGFFRWLLPDLDPSLVFRGWLDTRTPPFPGEPERVCDTLASFQNAADPGEWWALPVEFETEPTSDILDRLLEYVARLRRGLRQGGDPRAKYQVAAALVHLTGPVQSKSLAMYLPGLPAVGVQMQVALRTMREESASITLRGIANDQIDHCLLPWIPLMQGGTESSIIKQWQELAAKEPDSGFRSAYAALALVFAELKESLANWKQALEGWNMRQSQMVLGWQAERARVDLVEVLQARFQAGLPANLRDTLEGISDLGELSRLLKVAATAASLDAFRASMRP